MAQFQKGDRVLIANDFGSPLSGTVLVAYDGPYSVLYHVEDEDGYIHRGLVEERLQTVHYE